MLTLSVNETSHTLDLEPETPLLDGFEKRDPS
jgi:hypothetical protein